MLAVEPTDLYTGLCEIDAHCKVLSHEHVRIVGLGEGGLQFLQLVAGERCPESPLLPLALILGVTAVRTVRLSVRRLGEFSLVRRGGFGRAIGSSSLLLRRVGELRTLDILRYLGRRMLHSCYGHCKQVSLFQFDCGRIR